MLLSADYNKQDGAAKGGENSSAHLSAGSWKLTTAMGREAEAPELESERKHSFSALVKRGRSTGRPLM